jgi:hypothetical protein
MLSPNPLKSYLTKLQFVGVKYGAKGKTQELNSTIPNQFLLIQSDSLRSQNHGNGNQLMLYALKLQMVSTYNHLIKLKGIRYFQLSIFVMDL